MSNVTIAVIIYANPDYYPPTINAVKILAKHNKIILVCRNWEKPREEYPENVTVYRLGRYLKGEEYATRSSMAKFK